MVSDTTYNILCKDRVCIEHNHEIARHFKGNVYILPGLGPYTLNIGDFIFSWSHNIKGNGGVMAGELRNSIIQRVKENIYIVYAAQKNKSKDAC